MQEMGETLRTTFRRMLRLENRRAAVRHGRLEKIEAFESQILGNTRQITIFLPAGYDDRDDRRYPVLYMHDGQNLFEGHRAFVPDNHWRLNEAADRAIGERTASPMIIVGIDHAGPSRVDEYTPTRDEARNSGGRAEDHARMLAEELKPAIDARFRTIPDETCVGGSSLGGLVSLYLALRHSDWVRGAAVMSPSVWWNNRAVLADVDRFDSSHRPRIWLDIGGREGLEALQDARLLRDRLKSKGWRAEEDFLYYEDRRADHTERAWASRARKPLEFLFPPT
ncbi:MAG TPA: alpha/beta hydrolase-fold protein [Thermoanaerobaculia bacterium]|jgi:predicted alpha/beta superfamily hydrolase